MQYRNFGHTLPEAARRGCRHRPSASAVIPGVGGRHMAVFNLPVSDGRPHPDELLDQLKLYRGLHAIGYWVA